MNHCVGMAYVPAAIDAPKIRWKRGGEQRSFPPDMGGGEGSLGTSHAHQMLESAPSSTHGRSLFDGPAIDGPV